MIKVYTTPTCVYCHALLEWLDKEGIRYEEIDASTMPNVKAVPVTIIGDETIVGFDRRGVQEALKNVDNRAA